MKNSEKENAAYVAALKTKKARTNGQVLVCADKETERYEFMSLKDIDITGGQGLLAYLDAKNAALEATIAHLEATVAELSKKVNGADVL